MIIHTTEAKRLTKARVIQRSCVSTRVEALLAYVPSIVLHKDDRAPRLDTSMWRRLLQESGLFCTCTVKQLSVWGSCKPEIIFRENRCRTVERYSHTLGSLIKKRTHFCCCAEQKSLQPFCLFLPLKGSCYCTVFSEKEQTVTAEVKGVLFRKALNTGEQQ